MRQLCYFLFFLQLLKLNQQRLVTCGVPRVDDAQRSGAAVAPRLIQGPLQLADVQTPALLLVQIVVDLHCPEFSQRGRVERVLRDGDHDARASRAFATHEQLQNCLNAERTEDRGKMVFVSFTQKQMTCFI